MRGVNPPRRAIARPCRAGRQVSASTPIPDLRLDPVRLGSRHEQVRVLGRANKAIGHHAEAADHDIGKPHGVRVGDDAARSCTACWESFCPWATRWEGLSLRAARCWCSPLLAVELGPLSLVTGLEQRLLELRRLSGKRALHAGTRYLRDRPHSALRRAEPSWPCAPKVDCSRLRARGISENGQGGTEVVH